MPERYTQSEAESLCKEVVRNKVGEGAYENTYCESVLGEEYGEKKWYVICISHASPWG